MDVTTRTLDPHGKKLAAEIVTLQTRQEQLAQRQAVHGGSYTPEGEIGGIRSMSQKRKDQRMDRSVALATEWVQVSKELSALRTRYQLYVTGKIDQQGRRINPNRKPRRPSQPRGVDHPRAIEQELSIEGKHTLSTGATLELEIGWDEQRREGVGVVTLNADGHPVSRRAPSIQGAHLYDTALEMARQHLRERGTQMLNGAPSPGKRSA